MSGKSQYKTKQREEVLDFLISREGTHVTAAQVCDHLRGQGSPIGTATVYRQLERLVDEGTLNKYTIDGNSPACFEYVSSLRHCREGVCYHCKCEKCGTLIHLHCPQLEQLTRHMHADHGFFVDPRRTVFYGLCKDCMSLSMKKKEEPYGTD